MTNNTIIHVGDVGTLFQLSIVKADGVTPVDVSNATVKKILFRKGDWTTVVRDAVFYTDGTDGVIQYVSVEGDVSVPGIWQMQGYVEKPEGKFFSAIVTFSVESTIA